MCSTPTWSDSSDSNNRNTVRSIIFGLVLHWCPAIKALEKGGGTNGQESCLCLWWELRKEEPLKKSRTFWNPVCAWHLQGHLEVEFHQPKHLSISQIISAMSDWLKTRLVMGGGMGNQRHSFVLLHGNFRFCLALWNQHLLVKVPFASTKWSWELSFSKGSDWGRSGKYIHSVHSGLA